MGNFAMAGVALVLAVVMMFSAIHWFGDLLGERNALKVKVGLALASTLLLLAFAAKAIGWF